MVNGEPTQQELRTGEGIQQLQQRALEQARQRAISPQFQQQRIQEAEDIARAEFVAKREADLERADENIRQLEIRLQQAAASGNLTLERQTREKLDRAEDVRANVERGFTFESSAEAAFRESQREQQRQIISQDPSFLQAVRQREQQGFSTAAAQTIAREEFAVGQNFTLERAREVAEAGVSRVAEDIPELRQRAQLQFELQVKEQIKNFEDLGFSQEEARALGRQAALGQFTPSRRFAIERGIIEPTTRERFEQLRQEGLEAPAVLLQKGIETVVAPPQFAFEQAALGVQETTLPGREQLAQSLRGVAVGAPVVADISTFLFGGIPRAAIFAGQFGEQIREEFSQQLARQEQIERETPITFRDPAQLRAARQLIREQPLAQLPAFSGARLSPLTGAGEVLLGAGITGAAILGIAGGARSILGRRPTTSPFGVRSVQAGETTIELVPPRGTRLQTSPEQAIEQFQQFIPIRQNPSLPRIPNKLQRQIVQIEKNTEDIFTGSFSQQAILEKRFTRQFKDLDIASPNVPETVARIKKELGNKIIIKKQPTATTIIERRTGKELADIVPLSVAEGGFVTRFPTVRVSGINIADPRARLAGKTVALGRGLKIPKTKSDIEALIAEQELISEQAVRGGFGGTFEEQAAFFGEIGGVVTAQRGLFPRNIELLRKLGRRPTVEIQTPGQPLNSLGASLFASPFDIRTQAAQLRVSRLGITGKTEATLSDIFSGRISITPNRPQAVLFENVKVADVPQELRSLFQRALAGDTAARAEFFLKFRKFQLTPSGEFKPLGFPGTEAEFTLAPLEKIREIKSFPAFREAGKRVPIISAEIVKLSKAEISKIKKTLNRPEVEAILRKENPTAEEINRLERIIKKQTGRKIEFDSPEDIIRPVITPGVFTRELGRLRAATQVVTPSTQISQALIQQVSAQGAISLSPSQIGISNVPSVISPIRSISGLVGISGILSPAPSISPPPSPPPSSPSLVSPPSEPPRIPPVPRIFPEPDINGMRKKEESKVLVKGFDVFVKRKGKFIKISEKALPRPLALKLGAERTQKTLAATFKIEPSKKRVKPSKQQFTLGKQFRTFKIVKGKKIPLDNIFIEKRKFRLDSPQEKKNIQKARKERNLMGLSKKSKGGKMFK